MRRRASLDWSAANTSTFRANQVVSGKEYEVEHSWENHDEQKKYANQKRAPRLLHRRNVSAANRTRWRSGRRARSLALRQHGLADGFYHNSTCGGTCTCFLLGQRQYS